MNANKEKNLEWTKIENYKHNIYNELYQYVKNITSKAERAKWLQETFSHLIVSDSSKMKVFELNYDSNDDYALKLFNLLCFENPKIVSEYLKYDYRVWRDLFTDNDDAINEWFNHFSFDKYPIKGALALERFSFLNRDWFWDKYIVWKEKGYYSPVVVSNNLHYLMYIDVVKTVKKILNENLKEFWKSDEWINSLEDGSLVKNHRMYFSKVLLKKFHEKSKGLKKLVDQFISDTNFEDLCRWILINMDEHQFCEKCKIIRAVYPSIESALINFSSHNHFDDILALNGLFNRFRGRIVKYLGEDESIKTELITKISSSEDKDVEILYKEFNETISFLSNIKKNLSSGYYNLDDLKVLLLETLLFHFKLVNMIIPERESFEYFLTKYNISFDVVEIDRKKRKRKPHKEIKKIFAGWKIPNEHFYDDVNVSQNRKDNNEMRILTLNDIPIYLSSFLLYLISHNIREVK